MYSRDELDDMEYSYYSDMRDGYRKVRISESLFRCPFCYTDRKRDYSRIEELRRHASSAIDYSSRSKDAREKARHLALERYIRKYLSPQEGPDPTAAGELKGVEKKSISPCIDKAEPMSFVSADVPGRIGQARPKFSPKASNEDDTKPAKRACLGAGGKEGEEPVHGVSLAPKYPQRLDSLSASGNQDPKFVHPWTGILANVKRTFDEKQGRYVGESGSKLKEELIKKEFNPHKVEPLWNYRVGNTGFAMVHFGKGWECFENATMFDKHFEVNQCGKRDYDAARERGDKLYGWIAKEDDFYSRTVIGDHLRKKGDLKSVSGKEAEDHRKTLRLVSNLENTLETKSSSLQQMESKYKETSTALDKVMREKDDMINTHNERKFSCA